MQTNNYQKKYQKFIKSRPIRTKIKYDGCETHHIIPKSIGGSNDKDNLVVLTPKEHYIAHRLLAKCYTGEKRMKMSFALYSLGHFKNQHCKKRVFNSRQYRLIREQYHATMKTAEWKAWSSAKTKRQWTPERRARQAEITRQQWRDGKKEYLKSDAYKKKQSINRKKLWKDPAYREFQSRIQTLRWAERKINSVC